MSPKYKLNISHLCIKQRYLVGKQNKVVPTGIHSLLLTRFANVVNDGFQLKQLIFCCS